MSTGAHSARELTGRLVARAATGHGGADAEALAAASACELACTELSLSLGTPGFQVLLRRALTTAEPDFPFLASLRVKRHGELSFDDVERLTEENGAARVSAALVTVLDSILASLGFLIGDDLVARLLERDVHDSSQQQTANAESALTLQSRG